MVSNIHLLRDKYKPWTVEVFLCLNFDDYTHEYCQIQELVLAVTNTVHHLSAIQLYVDKVTDQTECINIHTGI